ncbi:hypothetical protein L7F22_068446 [Adiantum nelumboides]|nr:hypothetical protein [Adiantum nelumboides]
MTDLGEWFKSMHTLQNVGYVQIGDDTVHPIAHTSDVPLSTRNGKEKYLANVLHVPNITKNFVSVGQKVEQELQVKFNGDGLYVEEYKKNGKPVAQGKKVGRMFTLNVNMPKMNAAMFAQGTGVVADIEVWHKRIGHANVQRLKLMQSKELVTGLPQFRVFEMQQVCAACELGKQAKGSFPQERHNFKAMVEKQTGSFVQCLRLYGGGEYFSHEFSNFLKKHGIQRQFSCMYTPQQNGVAERKNRHIVEVAQALMSEKNMPPCYWAEVASTAIYTINRTPTIAVHGMTPEETFASSCKLYCTNRNNIVVLVCFAADKVAKVELALKDEDFEVRLVELGIHKFGKNVIEPNKIICDMGAKINLEHEGQIEANELQKIKLLDEDNFWEELEVQEPHLNTQAML